MDRTAQPVEEQADSHVAEAASKTFLGQWNRLVSTTNWEKGRIIFEWRDALKLSGATPLDYSDESWSRRVSGVSAQHVGRLRRTYERFNSQRDDFPGVYWSHFQVAYDWSDAEMWLEGAVQNGWSVAEMRSQRWDATRALSDGDAPLAEITAEEMDVDEDFLAPDADRGVVEDPTAELESRARNLPPDEAEAETERNYERGVPFDPDEASYTQEPPDEVPSPFASLPELPPDLAEAFESFKLAILRHKMAGWHDVSRQVCVATLEALRELALAPS